MNITQFHWGPTIWLASIAIIFIGLSIIMPFARKQSCIPQTSVALIVQAVLGIGILVNIGLVADDITYHASAVSQANSWASDMQSTTSFVGFGKESITVIVGILYYLFGANPLLGLILLAVLMAAIPVMMSASSRNFGFDSSASIAAWLGALSPPFLMWAPWLRREALAYFLLAGVVACLSLVYRGKLKAGIPLLVVLTAALAVTRAQLVLVALSGFVAALLLSRPLQRGEGKSRASGRIFPLVGAGLVLGLIASRLIPINYWTGFLNGGLGPGIASNSAADQNLRVSGVSWEFNSSPSGFLINIFRELWGPPLWEWGNLAWMIVGLDGLFYLFLTFLVVQTWRKCQQHRRAITILIIALVPLIVGTALTMANYGIVMRVRSHFMPFLIPIAAIYIQMAVTKLQPRMRSSNPFLKVPREATVAGTVSLQEVSNER